MEDLVDLLGGAIAIELLPSCTLGSESWRSHFHTIDLLDNKYLSSKRPAIFVEDIEVVNCTPIFVGRALTAVGSFSEMLDKILMSTEGTNMATACANFQRSILASTKSAINIDNVFCYEEGRIAVPLSEIPSMITLPGAYLTTEREIRVLFNELAEARRALEGRESSATATRVPKAASPRPFVKAGAWTGLLVGGALGLEYVNKAPWQDDSGARPLTNALRGLCQIKMPAATKAHEAPANPAPSQAAVATVAPEPVAPKRELLQAGLQKAANIIHEKGAVVTPAIDLSSHYNAHRTLREFAASVDNLPPDVSEKYDLWVSIETLVKNFDRPDAVDKFKSAIEAIAQGRPIEKPESETKWRWVPTPPKQLEAKSENRPELSYLERKEALLPAIKESLRPYDALLKSYGVPSPENRLGTVKEVMWTLLEYSDALRKVAPYHPAVDSLRYDSDQLDTATEEALKRYEKNFAATKLGNEAYQKARPELEPLLNKMLDQFGGGLMAAQQKVPSRDLSSLASTTETLIRFQTAISRVAPGNDDIGVLKDLIYGLKNDPRAQIGGLKAYLGIGDGPSK